LPAPETVRSDGGAGNQGYGKYSSHEVASAQDPGDPLMPESQRDMTIHTQHQMSLSITRSPDSSVDFVQIVGDVDLSDTHALGLAARQLIDTDASIVYVDLGGTTFMGSTLVAFLVHVGSNDRDRPGRTLVLCRPTPMALRVIQMTGLDKVATVQPDLPAHWPGEMPLEADRGGE
jgi:anti-anti-sigma factor